MPQAVENFEAPAAPPWTLALAPVLAIAVYALPLGLAPGARTLLAILVLSIIFWVTEAIPAPITALLAPTLAVFFSVTNVKNAFAPFGDPVIFLLIGSFLVAEATQASGLDRRLAVFILSQRWTRRSTGRLLFAMGLVTCVVSLWMSNSATTAMMLPIGAGVLRALRREDDDAKTPYAIAMMLMLTWSSSVAVGLPIASPPNLIAIGLSRELTTDPITFAGWTIVTMPMTAAMLALCWLLLHWRYRDAKLSTSGLDDYVASERERLGPWTIRQKSVAAVFVMLAILWLTPAVLVSVMGSGHRIAHWSEVHLPESFAAVFAGCLLFFLPAGGGRPALTWREAKEIDWGTMVLFGGGGLWGITAAAIVLGVVVSEAASNTAAANAVIPVVIAVAAAAGVSPTPPIFGAALGATFGFMLPVSTPPNAIVYASGFVPLREMIRAGIWLDITGAILIWLFLRLLCPLFGMT